MNPARPDTTHPEWVAKATQLRAEGYVHAHGNRYARTKDKGRGATWASILVAEDGTHRIEYDTSKGATR